MITSKRFSCRVEKAASGYGAVLWSLALIWAKQFGVVEVTRLYDDEEKDHELCVTIGQPCRLYGAAYGTGVSQNLIAAGGSGTNEACLFDANSRGVRPFLFSFVCPLFLYK